MKNGAGAPKDPGKPRPPAAANNLGNDITTSRQENVQAQPVHRLLRSDPAGGELDAGAGGGLHPHRSIHGTPASERG